VVKNAWRRARTLFGGAALLALLALGCNALLGIEDGDYGGPADDAGRETTVDPGVDAGAPSLTPSRTVVRLPLGRETTLSLDVRGGGALARPMITAQLSRADGVTVTVDDPLAGSSRRTVHVKSTPAAMIADRDLVLSATIAGTAVMTAPIKIRMGSPGTRDATWGLDSQVDFAGLITPGALFVVGRNVFGATGRTNSIEVWSFGEDGVSVRTGVIMLTPDQSMRGCDVGDVAVLDSGVAQMITHCGITGTIVDGGVTLGLPLAVGPTTEAVGTARSGSSSAYVLADLDAAVPLKIVLADGGLLESIDQLFVTEVVRGPTSALLVGEDGTSTRFFRLLTTPEPAIKVDSVFADAGFVLGPRLSALATSVMTANERPILLVWDLNALSSAIRRYLPDGSLDPTFSDGGTFEMTNASGIGLGIDDRDRLMVLYSGGAVSLGIQRLDSTGVVDTSFGMDGTAVLPEGNLCIAGRIIPDSDGMLIVLCEDGDQAAIFRLWP
jgi:hypothetical protein